MNASIVIAISSVILGAGFGFLSQTYLFRLNFRRSITESIINRYLAARDQICEALAECTHDQEFMDSARLEHNRIRITRLYYQYYDYIPTEVIQALVCFQVCLKSRNNNLYHIRNGEIVLVSDETLLSVIEQISLIDNLRMPLYLNLHCASPERARAFRIQYQARLTLVTINQYFTEKNLTNLNLLKGRS